MDFRDIITAVSGGASGLGAATATHFSRLGAKVAILDVNEKEGESLAEAIGGRFYKIDVTREREITDGFDAITQDLGTARVLVNCAGIAPGCKTVGRAGVVHDPALFRKTIEINLIGSFNLAACFASKLAEADLIGEERGVIINTSSIAAFDGQMGQAAYAASKAGVAGMALPMARDPAALNIRVMTIAPGIFWTPMLADMPEKVQQSLQAQVPHPSRFGKPEEYAALAEAIVTNPMLNAETIRLDGAVRMGSR